MRYVHAMKTILSLACILATVLPATVKAAERPNVVIIFIDDMGYGDVGFNGATGPKTPNLDRMAAEGKRFDHFYVGCAVCSGSRTALMTGTHYQRLSMQPVLFPHSNSGLHPDEVTIADMLKESGYKTACVGKWHLGHLPPCLPTYQGFDAYFGVPYSNDMWIDPANKLAADIELREGLTLDEVRAGHKKRNDVPLMRGEEVIEYPADQKTLTKRYTEESIEFITQNKEKPFFLYLPHTMVHLPLAVSKDFENRTGKLIWDAIEEVDWSVGQILSTLKSLGIDQKTLVLFTSDNGAAVGSSLPLRAKKGSVYDGGIREPTVMWWPGTIPAGKVCKEVAGTIDMLPTLAGLCGGKLPQQKIDGKDIKALMLGEPGATSPHEHYVLMHGPGTVRSGPWKFYPWRDTNKGRHAIQGYTPSQDSVQLYHVFDDIGERNNLASQHPEIVARLQAAYDAHVAEINANRRPTQLMTRPANSASSGLARRSRPPSKPINWSKVKIGDTYDNSQSPRVAERPFSISATINADTLSGIVLAQGGEVVGYSLYIKDGECVFAVRLSADRVHRVSTPIAKGKSRIAAGVDAKGKLSLQVNDGQPASAAGGLIGKHPAEALCIGHDDAKLVDEAASAIAFTGKLLSLKVE
jgi:arylsulfatase A